ncbi:glycoside hydrolase family 16 protein [Amylostereum chailletii]|nr:glycoside hydrolase family 16 protein [Amylostereum chailletii]
MRSISLASKAVLSLFLTGQVAGKMYLLTDTFTGQDFFDGFDWIAEPDPTEGLVQYVDKATAQSEGLATVEGGNFFLRADAQTILTGDTGRKSSRIQSVKSWDLHVSVYNVVHMPQGCGTWPAIWELGVGTWPVNGEVDILEGVNDVSPNAATLHTTPGCTMPDIRNETGVPTQASCDTAVNYNAGCGVHSPDANSYGPAFNANGGGWYAVERTDDFIKVWFWPRNSVDAPACVLEGDDNVNTDSWGTSFAYFPNTSCDIASHFNAANIIINLTFCGNWAGQSYSNDGCPGNCTDYVSNNPSAFTDAYFELASIRVYQ